MADDRGRTVLWSESRRACSDASDHAEEYLRQGADYVLLGEAEITLSHLCRTILAGGHLSRIAGLVSLTLELNT